MRTTDCCLMWYTVACVRRKQHCSSRRRWRQNDWSRSHIFVNNASESCQVITNVIVVDSRHQISDVNLQQMTIMTWIYNSANNHIPIVTRRYVCVGTNRAPVMIAPMYSQPWLHFLTEAFSSQHLWFVLNTLLYCDFMSVCWRVMNKMNRWVVLLLCLYACFAFPCNRFLVSTTGRKHEPTPHALSLRRSVMFQTSAFFWAQSHYTFFRESSAS